MLATIFLLFMLLFSFGLFLTGLINFISRVPYVPSRKSAIQKMLKLAQLKPGQTIYDLGCGDGRLLFTAEKHYRTQGIGFEIAPLVYLSGLLRKFITRSKSQIRFQNFFHVNLKNAHTIFCYLTPYALKKLVPKLKKECPKGTRIFSNTFSIEGLKPQKVFARDQKTKTPKIFLYQL